MKLGVTLDILNQKDTPAFYADTLANRPAAGFTGRVFISTDTYDLYRDTGTTWVLLSPSSTGTITGSGAAGQVTYFSAASSITGSNNLFWDTGNSRLGINTNTPTSPLDVHSSLSGVLMQLNQTSGTFDSQLAFQNANIAKWRIGSYYNAGNYSFGIYDVFNTRERFSVLNTGQTFVGDQVSSSGRLVINSGSLGDNGLVVISSSSPSIRINNAGTGANFKCGLGISTAANNFIQGSVDGDFCIFNANTGTYPILFGINDTGLGNVQEAARISAARNFLVGTSVDSGQKLQISGTSYFSSNVAIGTSISSAKLDVLENIQITEANSPSSSTQLNLFSRFSDNQRGYVILKAESISSGSSDLVITTRNNFTEGERLRIASNGAATFSNSVTTTQLNATTTIAGYAAILTNTNGAADSNGLLVKAGSIGTEYNVRFANQTDTSTFFTIKGNGNVLVNTTTDSGQKLQVNGDVATNGVKFPATQVPSADVNTLDDYEEGTFVPELKFGGNNVGMTYFDKIGNYTKIGRQVTLTIYLALTNKGSSTGNATIINLPFTATSINRAGASSGNITFDNITYVGTLCTAIGAGANSINFQQTTELGIDTSLTDTNFNNDSEMFITITYFS